MKQALSMSVLVVLSVAATGAFSQDGSSDNAAIVAFTGTIQYAVKKSDETVLGYYYASKGLKKIKFTDCEQATTEDLNVEDIEPTTETCKSLPGSKMPRLLGEMINSWTYDPMSKSYEVRAIDKPDAAASVVHCKDVPGTLLEAAHRQKDNQKGIVVGDVLSSTEANDLFQLAPDQKIVTVDSKQPPSDDCGNIPSFWTLSMGKTPTKAGDKLTVGLTVVDPGDSAAAMKFLQAN